MQKEFIADRLSGDCRTKVEGWLPRCMQFPAKGSSGHFVEQGEAQKANAVINETDKFVDTAY